MMPPVTKILYELFGLSQNLPNNLAASTHLTQA